VVTPDFSSTSGTSQTITDTARVSSLRKVSTRWMGALFRAAASTSMPVEWKVRTASRMLQTTGSPLTLKEVLSSAATPVRASKHSVPAGSYRIIAGSDMDDDAFLCDAGEACGAYRTLDAPEFFAVDPQTTPALSGLDFVSEFRAVIASPAGAAGPAAAAGAVPAPGLPLTKQAPP